MPSRIPLIEEPRQDFDINIEGQTYHFCVFHGVSIARWFFTVTEGIGGPPIASGRQITIGTGLLREPTFPGEITCHHNEEGDPPTRLDAWTAGGYALYHVTAEELAEIRARNPWF